MLGKIGTGLKEIAKIPLRTQVRIGEGFLGGVGDVQDLLSKASIAGFEKLTGVSVSEGTKETIKKLRVPTTEEFEKISNKAFGGILEPKSDWAKTADETLKNFGKVLGSPLRIGHKVLIALGGQVAKEGLKYTGTKESTQEYGRIGTEFVISLLNPGGATRYAQTLYNQANRFVRPLEDVGLPTTQNLNRLLTRFVARTNEGIQSAPGKATIREAAENLLEKTQAGPIRLRELIQANIDVNKFLQANLNPADRRQFLQLGRFIRGAIRRSASYTNPEFYQSWTAANEIFGAVAESQKASRAILRYLGESPVKTLTKITLAETLGGHGKAVLPTIGTAIGIGTGVKAYELASRLFTSPHLTRYYFDMVRNASLGNLPAMARSIKKIDDLLEIEERNAKKRSQKPSSTKSSSKSSSL